MTKAVRRLHLVPHENNSDEPMTLGNSIGQIAPDNWLTRAQMAKRIGRSKDTLKRWHNDGIYKATGIMKAGEINVWMYSVDDIDKLIDIASKLKRGRKPKTK